MVDIVEAKTSLHAEAIVVRGAVDPLSVNDPLILDLVGHLAADATIWTKGVDFAVRPHGPGLVGIEIGGGHQSAGGAGLDTLAARNAGRLAHGIVEIEHDLRAMGTVGHPDHVVHLDLAAGADAEIALNAGVEIDAHGRMAGIGGPALRRGEAAGCKPHEISLVPEVGAWIMRGCALRLIGHEQLNDHGPSLAGALGRRFHLHADAGGTLTGRSQHALALDLDHAGAAVPVRPVVAGVLVAEMRDMRADALGHLPDRLAGAGFDLLTVEVEGDRLLARLGLGLCADGPGGHHTRLATGLGSLGVGRAAGRVRGRLAAFVLLDVGLEVLRVLIFAHASTLPPSGALETDRGSI